MCNCASCHRLGTSPRPLSPLRNAPPRQMEAHHYLSADPTSDSVDGSRRRAQRAHDQAQQSHVSQASSKQHSSNILDCIWGLVRCIRLLSISKRRFAGCRSPLLHNGGTCSLHRQLIWACTAQAVSCITFYCVPAVDPSLRACSPMALHVITSSLVESHLAPHLHIASYCIQPQSYSTKEKNCSYRESSIPFGLNSLRCQTPCPICPPPTTPPPPLLPYVCTRLSRCR